MEEPLIDAVVLLEKFQGKGGWTYARVQDIPKGMRKLKGFVDDCDISCRLMSMGKGQWFIAIKEEIRRKINKQAGDYVHVVLYCDEPEKAAVKVLPEDFLTCLEDDTAALQYFKSFSEQDKLKYIDWVYAPQSDNERVERMAKAINRIALGLRI